ncbi:MAG: hypothetical protein HYV52_03345 [Parcubacteria group bacterium]|nr:hypothetical protein [Parcubacteria group bacterium]
MLKDIKIVIDLDNTLLDSHKLWESLGEDMEKLGVSKELWKEARARESARIKEAEEKGDYLQLYSIENIIDFLKEKLGSRFDFLFVFYHFLPRFAGLLNDSKEDCLFPDSKAFLEKHKKEIILLSFGNGVVQLSKILTTRLNRYLDPDRIFITKKEKWQFFSENWKADRGNFPPKFMIDDCPRNLRLIKEHNPSVITICIRRPEVYVDENIHRRSINFVVKSLTEVEEIVK